MDSELRTLYSMQFNPTAQKQAGDTGPELIFMSTRSRKGTWSYNLNAIPAGARI